MASLASVASIAQETMHAMTRATPSDAILRPKRIRVVGVRRSCYHVHRIVRSERVNNAY
jgi:hypothetical protein